MDFGPDRPSPVGMPQRYSRPIYLRLAEEEAAELESVVKNYKQKRTDVIRRAVSRYLAEIRREGKMVIHPQNQPPPGK
jgi:hypothetical protein